MVGDIPATGHAEQDRSADRSLDIAFDVLSDRRRRHILASLRDRGREIAISELAEDIAARDTGVFRGEVPPHANETRMEGAEDRVQELTASLYHVHIPKLEDAGIVEYDPDRDVVRPTASTQQVEHILGLTEHLSSG